MRWQKGSNRPCLRSRARHEQAPSDGVRVAPSDRPPRAFFENLLKAGSRCSRFDPVNLSSEVVTPGWQLPVGLLWIDGDHRYEAVRRDFEAWEPHLRGYVAFHDTIQTNLGPRQLVDELLESGFELAEAVQATKVLRRTGTQ